MPALTLSTQGAIPFETTRHTTITMLLHWTAALVVVSAFTLGLFLEDWPRGTVRDTAMMVHYSLGTLVLAMVLVRVLRRLLLPARFPAERGLMGRAAALAHWGLYAAMVGLPLTGAFDRWARGRRLSVFGDIVVPPPFPIPGGKLWKEAHELLGWAIAALVVAHVAASLWHHLVLRDGVLRRMLPARAG